MVTSETAAFSDNSITLTLSVGSTSATTTDITVADASLQGAVSAINAADLGVAAEIVDTGIDGIDTVFSSSVKQEPIKLSLTSDDDSISFSSVNRQPTLNSMSMVSNLPDPLMSSTMC